MVHRSYRLGGTRDDIGDRRKSLVLRQRFLITQSLSLLVMFVQLVAEKGARGLSTTSSFIRQ